MHRTVLACQILAEIQFLVQVLRVTRNTSSLDTLQMVLHHEAKPLQILMREEIRLSSTCLAMYPNTHAFWQYVLFASRLNL